MFYLAANYHIMFVCASTNFICAVNALHKVDSSIPLYSHELPQTLLCSPASRECWLNQCSTCSDGKGMPRQFQIDESITTTWLVWKYDSDGKLSKVIEEGTTKDLMDHICSMTPKFLEHCFIKRKQADSYNKERDAAGTKHAEPHNDALLQVDFSENYTCLFQDEIQSAHWQQAQVSLFTAALWFDSTLHPIVSL